MSSIIDKVSSAASDLVDRVTRADSIPNAAIYNVLSGLGTSEDAGSSSKAARSLKALEPQQLTTLYRGNIFAGRIVDELCDDATSHGYSIKEGGETDEALAEDLRRLGVSQAMADASRWARLYGGGAILLYLDDNADLAEPVEPDRVRNIERLQVVDRHELTVQDWGDDVNKTHYGQPLRYHHTAHTAASNAGPSVWHADRVIRFYGRKLPRIIAHQQDGWGDSVIQGVWQQLRQFNDVSGAGSHILSEMKTSVYKVAGLKDQISANGIDSQLLKRFALMNKLKGMANGIALDAATEEFEQRMASVAGIPEMHDRYARMVAAAAGMPASKLFGDSPQGLSSNNETGERQWQAAVVNHQTHVLQPVVEHVIELLTGGDARRYTIEWHPIASPSERESAETEDLISKADAQYLKWGVLRPEEVRRGVAERRGLNIDESTDLEQRTNNAIDDPVD